MKPEELFAEAHQAGVQLTVGYDIFEDHHVEPKLAISGEMNEWFRSQLEDNKDGLLDIAIASEWEHSCRQICEGEFAGADADTLEKMIFRLGIIAKRFPLAEQAIRHLRSQPTDEG